MSGLVLPKYGFLVRLAVPDLYFFLWNSLKSLNQRVANYPHKLAPLLHPWIDPATTLTLTVAVHSVDDSPQQPQSSFQCYESQLEWSNPLVSYNLIHLSCD